uniref:Uncharacterized protein n=1 Tax=Anguilla anguilla TaxID=7936 RepID=A0A0E9XT93_ANGAN
MAYYYACMYYITYYVLYYIHIFTSTLHEN